MRSGLAALGFAAACLAAPTAAHAQTPVQDPWEGFNRRLYALNDVLDHAIFEPVARGYRAVTPRPVRHGVSNFLNNLGTPVVFVNSLLQGHVGEAGTTVARFGINSTLGLFGVLDTASGMGFQRHDEDFGQTLGVWGAPPGPYVFLPVLGPTSVRDGVGNVVDLALDPLNWARFHHADTVRVSRAVVSAVSARESLLDSVDAVRRDSVDPYVSIRSSYSLMRESAIRNGPVEVQDLPDLQDIPEAPEPPTATPPDFQQDPSAPTTPSENPPQPMPSSSSGESK